MKKILFTFILLFTAVTMNAQTLRGDVNEDGVVDIADINAIIDIMKNGASTEEVRYYFWIIDDYHLGDYISESTHTFNASIIEKAVNSEVNSCPFLENIDYPAYNILQSNFSDYIAENNNATYLILPKIYTSVNPYHDKRLLINGKALTSSGFTFNVEEIGTTEYKLDIGNDNDNKVGYIIVKLTKEELSRSLFLKI